MNKLMMLVLALALAVPFMASAADISQTSSNAIPTEEVARTKYYKIVWDNIRDVCNTDIPALITDANTTRSALTSTAITVQNITVATNATIDSKYAITGPNATTEYMWQGGKITSTNGTGAVVYAAAYPNGTTPFVTLSGSGNTSNKLYITSVASNYFYFSEADATNDGVAYWHAAGTRP